MAFSAIEICNVALGIVGSEEIREFDKSTKRHRICEVMYKLNRTTLLSSYDWSFARKIATLRSAEEEAEATDFGNPYNVPLDCSRAIDILPVGTHQPWELIGEFIYTPIPNPVLRYTRAVDNTGYFNGPFISALTWSIAASIAPTLRQDKKFEASMANMAAIKLMEAQEADARIGSTYREADNDPNLDSFVDPEASDYLRSGIGYGDT
jgi:hypothetical protein